MAIPWLGTFIPRRIAVFEDWVEITRLGRGTSTRSLFYSDIRGVEIGAYKTHYRVILQLKTNRDVMLVAPDQASADRIKDTFEKSNGVPGKSSQSTTVVSNH